MFLIISLAFFSSFLSFCPSHPNIELQKKIVWTPFLFLSLTQLGRLEYGYEYIGLNGRLIITPGTEKVYFAIAQAINMQMGCMLNGQENCGKTETIKDLARICAIFSVIRNCTDLMDVKTVHTTLIGLVQCGWGILTNFNHMRNTVINAISMSIHALNMALTSKRPTFQFQVI